MYRVKYRIALKIMCGLFNEGNAPYDLRQDVCFRSYNVKTVLYGAETLSYLGPKIWNLVPSDILVPSEIVRQIQCFAKRLKNGNQIDVQLGSAKYTFLI